MDHFNSMVKLDLPNTDSLFNPYFLLYKLFPSLDFPVSSIYKWVAVVLWSQTDHLMILGPILIENLSSEQQLRT